MRVSIVDQRPEVQLYDLRQIAAQHGSEVVQEYTDRISVVQARGYGFGQLMRDARHGKFDVVQVWAGDRIARSVKHFLEILDALNRLQVDFISFRTTSPKQLPAGRARGRRPQ